MVIKGDIEDIRFRNEENGFTIIVADVQGEYVICKGIFPPLIEGQTVSMEGKFVLHPKFGRQFDVETVKIEAPDTIDGIVRYLGSGIIKGIGPALALRIVSVFGNQTFKVIEFTPHLLAQVKGISKKRAVAIGEAYGEIKVMQDAVMFLQQYGITINTAIKIYNTYQTETVEIISSNPYVLVEDVDGIGFITADKIAQNMGIERESEFRIRAGLIYTLKESVRSSGNTFLPTQDLISQASRLLGLSEQTTQSVIPLLITERKVKQVNVEEVEGIMLSSVYRAEFDVANKVVSLIENRNFIGYEVEKDIKHFEKINGITFHQTQKDAINLAINSGAVIITGGPGTGKTTIIKCILRLYELLGKTVMCMAPTGRASKRMTEATGYEAKTIHRALGLTPDSSEDDKEPLCCDVVIVDEFSMVDIFLFRSLLSRLTAGTKLIIVGDKDQLPSVGAGNVLSDLIQSGVIPFVGLTHIYRQSLDSLIVTNAHAINKGEMPEINNQSKDFFFMKATSTDEIANKTTEVASQRIPKFLGVDPKSVQVLCPLKQGVAGVINLNKRLQETINATRTSFVEVGDYQFFVGDKVMHVVNNYELEWKIVKGYCVSSGAGVFNGDIGTVVEVDKVANALTVEFEDGREVRYEGETLHELMLAYAVTVHKSQGSEFDAVIMPVVSGSSMILTRNLLYTAVTRAKKAVVLIGDEYNLKKMVGNDYIAKRYSALKSFIHTAIIKRGLLYGNATDAI